MKLTPQLRAYFRRLDRRLLLVDVVRDLTQDFGLSPQEAGRVIVAAVLEDWIEDGPAPLKPAA